MGHHILCFDFIQNEDNLDLFNSYQDLSSTSMPLRRHIAWSQVAVQMVEKHQGIFKQISDSEWKIAEIIEI